MKVLTICSIAILMYAGVAEAATQEAALGASGAPAVLFSDDFSVPSDRWDVDGPASGESRYVPGAMLLRAATRDGSIFVAYDRSFTDHIIQVETKLVGGTDDNWATVSCRYSPDGDYYDLGVSADGFYMLDVWVDGRRLSKSIGPTRSRHIRLGRNAVNVILAECVGNRLSLSVNGHHLAELIDNNHASGAVALSVDALAGSYSSVEFDNLVISRR